MVAGVFHRQEQAKRSVMSGLVYINGRRPKASQPVVETDEITVEETQPFVSRGGLKLQRAMEVFAIDVAGKVCLMWARPPAGSTVRLPTGRRRSTPSTWADHGLKPGRTSVVVMERTNAEIWSLHGLRKS